MTERRTRSSSAALNLRVSIPLYAALQSTKKPNQVSFTEFALVRFYAHARLAKPSALSESHCHCVCCPSVVASDLPYTPTQYICLSRRARIDHVMPHSFNADKRPALVSSLPPPHTRDFQKQNIHTRYSHTHAKTHSHTHPDFHSHIHSITHSTGADELDSRLR